MPVSPIARLGAASLGAGSVLSAAFVVLARGQTAGASAMMSTGWLIAHNLQFAGAALLVFGVVGLYLVQESRLTASGHLAFVLALMWVRARAGAFPAWMGTLIAAGAVLLAASQYPFGPLPWSVAAIGSILMALGMVAIAAQVWRSVPTPTGKALG